MTAAQRNAAKHYESLIVNLNRKKIETFNSSTTCDTRGENSKLGYDEDRKRYTLH